MQIVAIPSKPGQRLQSGSGHNDAPGTVVSQSLPNQVNDFNTPGRHQRRNGIQSQSLPNQVNDFNVCVHAQLKTVDGVSQSLPNQVNDFNASTAFDKLSMAI